MKHLFFSAAQLDALQRAYDRADMGTETQRHALRVAVTDDVKVLAFTASPEFEGADQKHPQSIAAKAFEDMTYLGTISSEEQILINEDGVTPAGYAFAANRNIPATVKSITAQADNLDFRNNNRVPDAQEFALF